jgi:segregation and condensation protein B
MSFKPSHPSTLRKWQPFQRLGVAHAARGFDRIWQFRPLSQAPQQVTRGDGVFWRESEIGRVEAVLFLAKEPLSSRKIAQLASLADGTQARTLIRRLNGLYDAAGCAFRAEEVAGGFLLVTRPMFGPWLRRMLQTSVESRLSGPALETLAVVAYRQPILRAEIEAVRGVQCGEMLRQLLERDLVRIAGRADDLGRPLMYGTTKRFLELFGLKNLEELPRATELRAGGLPSRASDANNNATNDDNSGVSRVEGNLSHDRISEEESVTTSIRPSTARDEDFVEGTATALLEASRRNSIVKPMKAADEDEESDDEEWDDDEDDEDDDEEDEEDDFVEEEWEEVGDDDEDSDEEDEEDDEDWDDDDEEWDDDEEEEADDEE